MPSPFPGMDPYLEEPTGWGGVHLGMIYAIQAELNRVLPDNVRAKIDEYIWVSDTDDDETRTRSVKPDVFLPRTNGLRHPAAVMARPGTAPTARGKLPKNPRRKNRVVKIVTGRGLQVLTVLEVLSPTNKGAGKDRQAYVHKRQEYLASVNLVEFDLLRSGSRLAMGRPEPPPADYYVFSCRQDEYPATETWAFTVRDPLPTIAVPVSREYGDVPLDLRAALDRVYEDGKYAAEIDYARPPSPVLRNDDAEWAADLLKKHTRKKK